jgi:hypothetical protein
MGKEEYTVAIVRRSFVVCWKGEERDASGWCDLESESLPRLFNHGLNYATARVDKVDGCGLLKLHALLTAEWVFRSAELWTDGTMEHNKRPR